MSKFTFEPLAVPDLIVVKPTAEESERASILRHWREGGYQAVVHEYYSSHRKWLARIRIKMFVPRPVKRMAKKLLGRT